MTEVTGETTFEREKLERKFFAVKNENGEYLRSWHFTKYLNNATTWNLEKTAIKECQDLLKYQKQNPEEHNDFTRLFIVEVKFVEVEE